MELASTSSMPFATSRNDAARDGWERNISRTASSHGARTGSSAMTTSLLSVPQRRCG
jgi:hypothetical protein